MNLSQNNGDDSVLKRSLRPRKVENYKQMLDGDEVTIKTIQDEQLELRKKKIDVLEEDEDELMDDAQIERASDDEVDEEFPLVKRSARKRGKILLDDEEDAEEEESSENEEPLDDVENESFNADETNKRK